MARLFTLLSLTLVLFSACSLIAAEHQSVDPVLLRPFPEGLAIHARIVDPERIETHPLVQRIVALMETSQEWQRVNQDVTRLVQFSEAVRHVDTQLKQAGVAGGIRTLWKRGVVFAVGEGQNPPSGGVFLAQDEAAAQGFVDVLSRWADTELGLKYSPVDIDGTSALAAGDLHVAVLGHRVVWANQAEAMRHVLRHVHSADSDSAAPDDPTLLADLNVSLAVVRKNPDFAKGLENPASDFGLLTFFGGWTDLLRRHERLAISLHAREGEAVSLKIGFREPTAPRSEALAPFWAHGEEKIAAPLNPPGTIESFSWYRDYATLWNNRRQLASTETIERVEKQDDDAGKTLAVFGTKFKPSELISQLGPHFRVVITEQEKVPYDKVDVENVLPAAAFVVDLRDEEKFRTMTEPFVNLLGLIQGGEQRVLTVREEYKGAKTVSYVYQETDQEVRMRARDSYNFRVTGSITRGHFILGATPGIVRAVIDELDASPTASPENAHVTERQVFHFPRLARQLGRMRSNVIRRIVLDTGWTVEQAEHEYQIALGILASFGAGEVRLGDDASGFSIEIEIGKEVDR